MMSTINNQMRGIRNLLRDRRGNFGIMTAIMIPVGVAGAGMAIDASNFLVTRGQMQEATDSAALAAATALANGTADTTTAPQLAKNFVSGQMANFLSGDTAAMTALKAGTTANITSSTTANGGTAYTVTVNSSYSMPVNGMTQVLGWNSVNLSTSSSTTSGAGTGAADLTPVSMYLVLDRSGSMDEATDTVNAEQPTTTTTTTTTTCTSYNKNGSCKKSSTSTTTTTTPNYYTKMQSLKIAVGKLTTQLNTVDPNSQYVRTGADSFNNVAQTPTALAWGTSGVTSYVNNLTSSGTTDSSGAFANGYNALIAATEDAAHLAKNGKVPTKYIVFMTDGENNVANADTNTKASCDLARQAGIKVYTIALMAPDAGKALLTYCATSTDTYFNVSDADQLIKAFQSIGAQATNQVTLLTK